MFLTLLCTPLFSAYHIFSPGEIRFSLRQRYSCRSWKYDADWHLHERSSYQALVSGLHTEYCPHVLPKMSVYLRMLSVYGVTANGSGISSIWGDVHLGARFLATRHPVVFFLHSFVKLPYLYRSSIHTLNAADYLLRGGHLEVQLFGLQMEYPIPDSEFAFRLDISFQAQDKMPNGVYPADRLLLKPEISWRPFGHLAEFSLFEDVRIGIPGQDPMGRPRLLSSQLITGLTAELFPGKPFSLSINVRSNLWGQNSDVGPDIHTSASLSWGGDKS